MRIRYACPEGWPPLARPTPAISAEDRRRSRLDPPPALPLHCKPWIDAQSHGVLLCSPFRSTLHLLGRRGEAPRVRIEGSATEHVMTAHEVSAFSTTHFGLATQYTIRTDEGVGLLTLPVEPLQPGAPQLVRGLVETWWYPHPLFLVFAAPPPGVVVTIAPGQPLAVLAPVVCAPHTVEPMTAAEGEDLARQREAYQQYLVDHPELRWTSAEGHDFSSAYKALARHRARQQKP